MPLSPRIRTADGLAATLRATAIIRRTAGPDPRISSKISAAAVGSGLPGASPRSRSWSWRIMIRRCCSAIFSTLSRSSWLSDSSVCWMPAEWSVSVAIEPSAPRKAISSSS